MECLTMTNDARGLSRRQQHSGIFPTGYNGPPRICPRNYSFPLMDPQTSLPASSLDPFVLPPQMASGFDPPFFHNALDRQTNRWLTRMVCNYSPLMLYRLQRGLIILTGGYSNGSTRPYHSKIAPSHREICTPD